MFLHRIVVLLSNFCFPISSLNMLWVGFLYWFLHRIVVLSSNFRVSLFLRYIYFLSDFCLFPPKRSRGCLMSPLCLEFHGCHLIPLYYLISCSSAESCNSFCFVFFFFSACWPIPLTVFQKIFQYFVKRRVYCMAPV